MTPSKRAKELGCRSLVQLSDKTGIPQRTLKDWHYKKPEAFRKLCILVASNHRELER